MKVFLIIDSLILTTVYWLLCSATALSQGIWAADIQVKSVEAIQTARGLTLNTEIFSTNDDGARETTVQILFPPEVKLISATDSCAASESAVRRGTQGLATCFLGPVNREESRLLTLTTTLPPENIKKKFGVFVWSITPDLNPSNNYAEVSVE